MAPKMGGRKASSAAPASSPSTQSRLSFAVNSNRAGSVPEQGPTQNSPRLEEQFESSNWIEFNEAEEEHDTQCKSCQRGKPSVLCELCPAAFHPECASFSKVIPAGTWLCPECCRLVPCKRCNETGAETDCVTCGNAFHLKCLPETEGICRPCRKYAPFDVERILWRRIRSFPLAAGHERKLTEYLIKWKGKPLLHTEWRRPEFLRRQCSTKLTTFEKSFDPISDEWEGKSNGILQESLEVDRIIATRCVVCVVLLCCCVLCVVCCVLCVVLLCCCVVVCCVLCVVALCISIFF
jgi:hypothetical protein